MSTEVFNNNVTTTLSASINSSQTTITLTSATGIPILAAGEYFRAVLTPSSVPGSAFEYLEVTGVSGTTLTVVRGQENSTAASWNSGDIFYMTATAASFADFASGSVSGVSSFNTRTGAVTLTSGDVTTALTYTPANLISPAFTGVPTAPTAPTGTNTAQLATCAFVIANAGGGTSGVSSFNTRTGAVTLTSSDVTSALTYTPANINGTNATGTWTINTSGNAATATTATSATTATTATTANALNTSNSYTGSSFTANNGMTINLGSASSALNIATGGVKLTAANSTNGYGIQWGTAVSANFSGTGNFQINTTTTALNLSGKSDGTYCVYGLNSGSVVTGLNTSGTWVAISDRDKKENIQPLIYGLDAVLALEPVSFQMISDGENAPVYLGFIAQDVETVIPEAVTSIGDNKGLNKDGILAALVKAVHELNAKVEALSK